MIQEIKEKEKTSFVRIMGNSPINRILDFLIENDRTNWSMIEIKDGAKVGYATLKLILPRLLNKNLIAIDKEIGKVKLYKINSENSIVKRIYDLYKEINRAELRNI